MDFCVPLECVQGSTPCQLYEIVSHTHTHTHIPPLPSHPLRHLIQVVCRLLGYPGASRASSFGEYDAGNHTIWMDGIQCVGNESSLALCHFSGLADHNCAHVDDAGVVCSGRGGPA